MSKSKQPKTTFESARRTQRRADSSVDNSQHRMSLYIAFGTLVRIARSKRGISQGSLASRVQIDRAYLSEIEGGKRSFSFFIGCRLLRELDIPFDLNVLFKDFDE